jgi:hypothetical protein
MKKSSVILITISLMLTGCATTTTGYTINGVEPKREDSTFKTVGSIVLAGALLYALSPNKGKQVCKSYVSGPAGGAPTQVITQYKDKC